MRASLKGPTERSAADLGHRTGHSSSIRDFGLHRPLHPEVTFVETITLRMELIDSMGLDLENVDYLVTGLQVCDLRAIKGMAGLLDGFVAVYSEVNSGQVTATTTTPSRVGCLP